MPPPLPSSGKPAMPALPGGGGGKKKQQGKLMPPLPGGAAAGGAKAPAAQPFPPHMLTALAQQMVADESKHETTPRPVAPMPALPAKKPMPALPSGGGGAKKPMPALPGGGGGDKKSTPVRSRSDTGAWGAVMDPSSTGVPQQPDTSAPLLKPPKKSAMPALPQEADDKEEEEEDEEDAAEQTAPSTKPQMPELPSKAATAKKPMPALPGGGGADKKKAMPALPGGAGSVGRPRADTGAGGVLNRPGSAGKTPPLPSKGAGGMPALPQGAEDEEDEVEEVSKSTPPLPAKASKPMPALPAKAPLPVKLTLKSKPPLPAGAKVRHPLSPASGTVCRLENGKLDMFLRSSEDDESVIEQGPTDSSANAEWTLVDALSGSPMRQGKHARPEFYCLLNRESMLCLSVAIDQSVTVSDDADAEQAHWSIESGTGAADGFFALKNRASQKFLNIAGGGNGAVADLCDTKANKGAHWRIARPVPQQVPASPKSPTSPTSPKALPQLPSQPKLSGSPKAMPALPSPKPVVKLNVKPPLPVAAKPRHPSSPKSGAVCRLENMNSGLMLRCNEDDEEAIEQWTPDSSASAEWTLLDASNASPARGKKPQTPEFYCLLNRLSMLCLSIKSGQTQNGADVTVSDDADAHDAHWSIVHGESGPVPGVFALKNRACGKYLCVSGARRAAGTRVQLWSKADERAATLWKIAPTAAQTPKKKPKSLRSPKPAKKKAPPLPVKSPRSGNPPPPPPLSAQRMLRRAQLLQTVPMFADLSLKEQTDVAAELELTKFTVGEKVCTQGQKADAMYIVEEGGLAADVDGQVVKQYSRGGVFGELALLSGKRRAASVTAVRSSKLLRLSRDQFHKCAKNNSATLWNQVEDYAAGRIQAAWRGQLGVRDLLMDASESSDSSSSDEDERDEDEEQEDEDLRTKEEMKTSVVLTLMEAMEGDVLDKRGGVFRTDEMKQQTIEMFGLQGNIEYETFMRIVLKIQASFRRKIEWKKVVLQTMMAQMGIEPEPEPAKPFPPPRSAPLSESAKPVRTASPAAAAVDASIAARRSQSQMSLSPTRSTSMSPPTTPLPPAGSPVSAMIAATGRLTNAEHDELLRQQLAAAEQSVSERRNTPDARRITVMRRQMEGVAVAHAIAQMVVTASKQAATRVAQLSNATENDEGEAEVDSHEEELLHLVELQRDVESFGTRLMTLLSTMVVEAANSTGLYTKQIEAEEAKATEGY